MRLFAKYLLFVLAVGVVNILLASFVPVQTAVLVVLVLLEVSAFTIVAILKPLVSLYNALYVIDFDKDVIDFEKMDLLEPSGVSEIRFLAEKFKYLLDIVAERINRVNDATYESEHDALTGCYNIARLKTMKSSYEMAKSFAIIFIDVNNLKRMNDEIGHDAGDALLKSATEHMKFWDKYGDVYRIGGDEFLIVVQNRSPEQIKNMVRKWYPTVGVLNRESDGFRCVLSYGVSFGKRGSNFDKLKDEADERMYVMKKAIKKKYGEPMR